MTDVYVVDLVKRGAPGPPVVANRTFEDVRLLGPAVVYVRNGAMIECQFNYDGNLESILWEIQPHRTVITGAIVLLDCTFRRCEFNGIGFAGEPNILAKMRRLIASDNG